MGVVQFLEDFNARDKAHFQPFLLACQAGKVPVGAEKPPKGGPRGAGRGAECPPMRAGRAWAKPRFYAVCEVLVD